MKLDGFSVRGDTIIIGGPAPTEKKEPAQETPADEPKTKSETKRESAVARLIKWVQIHFVDVNFGKGTGDGNGKKGQGNSLAQGDNGTGKVKSRDGRVGYDDDMPKNPGAGKFPGVEDNGDGDQSPPGTGKVISDNGTSKAFDLWYPMCLFMGESVSQGGGNATVKAMVDEFAQKCGVNLIVFPVAVMGLPDRQPDLVNAWQMQVCNASQAFGVRQASTSTCVNDNQSADIMCNSTEAVPPNGWKYTEKVAGCAQLGGVPGETQNIQNYYNSLQQNNGALFGGMSNGGGGGGSGAVPSIEDVGSCDNGTVNHEAIGHSAMGWGHGPEAGYGIGKSGGAQGTGSSGWTDVGCGVIQKSSFPNDGRWRWNPNQQTYYVQPTDPSLWKQFGDTTPLFGGIKNPPNGAGANLVNNGQTGGDPNNSDPRLIVQNDPKQPNSQKPDKGTVSFATDPGSKHKKKPKPAKSPEEILASLKEESMGSAPEDRSLPPGNISVNPPDPGKPKEGGRIKFDDNAAKVKVGSTGSGYASEKKAAGGPATAKPGGYSSGSGVGQIYGDSVDFHDSVPSAVGGNTPVPASGPGGASGGTIKYDDSRVKGANLTGEVPNTRTKKGQVVEGAPSTPWYSDDERDPLVTSGAVGSSNLNEKFFDGVGKIIDEDEEEQMKRYKGQLKRRPASLKKGAKKIQGKGDRQIR